MNRVTIKVLTVMVCGILAAGPGRAADLNLSAAASMKEAVSQIADNFAKKTPGVHIRKNFGASGALAKQIENGAPSDVFISANLEWVDYLKGKDLVGKDGVATLAFNELVFVGLPERKADNLLGNPQKKVGALKDVARLDRIAIGSPKSVPAGEYALTAIKHAGLQAQLEKKLVMAKDVRECLMYADRGEVDGAFVYKTDAAMAQTVKTLFTVPQDLYPRVTYPMALTVSGGRKAEAAAFFKYLQSPAAKAVLAKYGFAVK